MKNIQDLHLAQALIRAPEGNSEDVPMVDALFVTTQKPAEPHKGPSFARDVLSRINTTMSLSDLESLHKRLGELVMQTRSFQSRRAKSDIRCEREQWIPSRTRRGNYDRNPVDMVAWSFVATNSDLAPRVLMGDELTVNSLAEPADGDIVVVANARGAHRLRVYLRDSFFNHVALGFAKPGREPEPLLPSEQVIGVVEMLNRSFRQPPWASGWEWVTTLNSNHLAPEIPDGSMLLMKPTKSPVSGDVAIVSGHGVDQYLRVHQGKKQEEKQALLVIDPTLNFSARPLYQEEVVLGVVIDHWMPAA